MSRRTAEIPPYETGRELAVVAVLLAVTAVLALFALPFVAVSGGADNGAAPAQQPVVADVALRGPASLPLSHSRLGPVVRRTTVHPRLGPVVRRTTSHSRLGPVFRHTTASATSALVGTVSA